MGFPLHPKALELGVLENEKDFGKIKFKMRTAQ
jgi:hypothetical protein